MGRKKNGTTFKKQHLKRTKTTIIAHSKEINIGKIVYTEIEEMFILQMIH
jgi:hypothetical protein